MANSNFIVQHGLTVGPLTIDAATGDIETTGNIQATGAGPLIVSPDNSATPFLAGAGLTDEVIVATKSVDSFIQIALHNPSSGTSASSDFIAYADTGDNTQGYVDMGIASSMFDDPAYGITFAGDSYIFASAPAGTGGNLVLATENGTVGDIVFAAGGFFDGTEQGRFILNDGLKLTGNLIADGGTIYQGPLAKEFEASAGITDPSAIFTADISSFAQVALHNNNDGISASGDFIVYADTGTNDGGYIDMGIASSTFADPAFAVTKAGDGYIFVSAPTYAGNAQPTGGNLVLATADGVNNDIVFAAGGFFDGTEQGRFVLNDGFLVQGNLVSKGGVVYQGSASDGRTARDLTIDSAIFDVTSEVQSMSKTPGVISLVYTSGATILPTIVNNNMIEFGGYSGSDSTAVNGYHTVTNVNTGTRTITLTAVGLTGSGSLTIGTTDFRMYGTGHYVGITNASGIFTGESDGFVQFALKNFGSGTSASTDIIAYSSNGDNESGWIDMGITGENFADATYGVTGPDDGYIFMSAPNTGEATPTGNGDLFVSTSNNGAHNDIVFSTNGFQAGTERMRIVGQDRVGKPAGVEIYIPTESTSTSTGALRIHGGMGLLGNLNVAGNVSIVGNLSFGGNGTTVSSQTLTIEDPITFLANANNGDSQDIGVVGQYHTSANVFTGFVRDSVTKSWRLFDSLTTRPTSTVNWAGTVAANVYVGSAWVANTTVSTSATTGALIVKGGIGVGANSVFAGHILPSANLTYDLGSGTAWWNTFYGVSTQAKYADLAENYLADSAYPFGTVLMFGGDKEVTVATADTKAVAGVVSQNPAHLMNGQLRGSNVVPLALTGRVPCNVVGPVKKGDLMVSAGFGYAKANNDALPGQIIGKALNDFPSGKGQIEVVVGRF